MTDRDRLIKLISKEVPRPKADALADYLIANGVIVPPCKVGQKIWELCQWTYREAEIREGKISMLQQKADKSWKFRISVNSSVYDITPDKIGERIFLTKEEAEEKLKGLSKNGL